MLLRFTVENALCFGPEASLSMVATNDERHLSHISHSKGKGPDILRMAVLYGANGHGKTNIVRAIAALKKLVVRQTWTLPRFKLNPTLLKSPTKLVIEFRQKEIDYEYGVIIDGKVISEEWLFMTNEKGKEYKIFERISKKTSKGFETILSPGDYLKRVNSHVEGIKMDKYLQILSSGLKETRPFLSEAKERSLPVLDAPFKWFSSRLTPVEATSSYAPLFERVSSDSKFRIFLEEFMKKCDIGIEELRASSIKVDPSTLASMPSSIKDRVDTLEKNTVLKIEDDGISLVFERDDEGDLVIKNIEAVRHNIAGDKIDFTFDEESAGTRRLLDLAPMLADEADEHVYIVDELDRKLHPMLSYKFVEEFLSRKRGQLILTTHNTHLMDLDLLRRDEIWFVQKKTDGSSELYSLAEMKIRPDLNVRKGYISGRFGAIPFLGNFPQSNLD